MVAIKNAAVPPSCYFCPMTNDGFYLCKANNPYKILEDDCEERRPDWCPLIEIQEPHGRLIGADALRLKIGDYIDEYNDIDDEGLHNLKWCAMKEAEMAIVTAPTIIPA